MAVTKELDYLDRFGNLVSDLVINDTKITPVETLAKIAGKSVSLIYRSASPHDETPFNIFWAPAFMNIKNNYAVLDEINRLCGRLPSTKIPTYKLLKEDEMKVAKTFTKSLHHISEDFEDHLEYPTIENYKDFKKNAEETIKQILSSIHYAKKAVKGIGELEL